jgi:hypothetical protein
MEFETPNLEGADDLPNLGQTIPNYAKLDVKRVMVYGVRIVDQFDKKAKYKPRLCLFLNEVDKEPVVLNLMLHEVFDDAEVMARMGVIWANQMFGHVAKTVKIFDYETEKLRTEINVWQLLEVEEAVEELREINQTNKYKVH